jgi:hypothetical protein
MAKKVLPHPGALTQEWLISERRTYSLPESGPELLENAKKCEKARREKIR